MTPFDGATNVASSTQVYWQIGSPTEGVDYATYGQLYNADGQPSNLPFDPSCTGYTSTYHIDCYDLAPNTTYRFETGYFCYSAPAQLHPVATATFKTAP